MCEKKFNLLTESWIRVENHNGESLEVSFLDLFENAPSYLCLAGESKHQDFAVLRLLEAILISVLYEDEEDFLENPEDAYRVWGEIYESGKFPIEKIHTYLEQYQDRFYLIHPETPFAQVVNPIIDETKSGKPESEKVKKALVMGVKKLDGSYLESENKYRYFRHDDPTEMSYAEAARWLLNMLNFDDNAVKAGKSTSGKPSGSKMVGWLGNFSPVYVTGENLFKTLMLNLILCNRKDDLWGVPEPIWEKDPEESLSRWVSIPNNLPELYTTYARRVWLEDSGEAVTRFTSYPGEIFDYRKIQDFRSYANLTSEPHMIFRKRKVTEKKIKKTTLTSKRMASEKELWTYYADICTDTEESTVPLIILWVSRLCRNDVLNPNEIVSLLALQTEYASTGSGSIGELNVNEITLHSGVIDTPEPPDPDNKNEQEGDQKDQGKAIYKSKIIADEVKNLNELVFQAGSLTDHLSTLRGSRKSDRSGSQKMMRMLTEPFKSWLFQFNPATEDEQNTQVEEWRNTAKSLAYKFLGEIERDTEPELLRLKTIEVGKTKLERNSAQFMNYFAKAIHKIYSNPEEGNNAKK